MVYCSVLQESSLHRCDGVVDFCEDLLSKHIRSPHLLAFLVDCFDEMLEEGNCEKDATLRRALNVRTIPQSYPIIVTFEIQARRVCFSFVLNSRKKSTRFVANIGSTLHARSPTNTELPARNLFFENNNNNNNMVTADSCSDRPTSTQVFQSIFDYLIYVRQKLFQIFGCIAPFANSGMLQTYPV